MITQNLKYTKLGAKWDKMGEKNAAPTKIIMVQIVFRGEEKHFKWHFYYAIRNELYMFKIWNIFVKRIKHCQKTTIYLSVFIFLFYENIKKNYSLNLIRKEQMQINARTNKKCRFQHRQINVNLYVKCKARMITIGIKINSF